MIELTKHIEILLLENDCVIVPGLGGFIAHHQPARYEEDEGVFLPPTRTVGFNPQLTMNDGLLTQAYMQTYHTDFPDASRKIAQKVNELKEILYNEGVMEMPGIGSLYYTLYNTYEFHPQESGVLSPTLYGLDAYTMTPLSVLPVLEVPMEQKKEKKEFHLNPQWLSNAVAVVIAAVLFFALSFPVENTYVDKGVYASLGTDCLFDAIRSHSMATSLPIQEVEETQKQKASSVVPVAVKVEKVAPVANTEVQVQTTKAPKQEISKEETVKKETPKVVEAPKAKEIPARAKVSEPKKETPKVVAKKKNYHIIVASLATSSDANRMLKKYQQQGYSEAVVKENNGRFRISLCSYADKSVAYQKLNELKKADAFKGAWVLTSK